MSKENGFARKVAPLEEGMVCIVAPWKASMMLLRPWERGVKDFLTESVLGGGGILSSTFNFITKY